MTSIELFGLAAAFMVLAALYPAAFLRLARVAFHKLPGRGSGVAMGLAERFIGGFEGLHRPSRLITVFALSVPVWLAEVGAYYVVALGFDLQTEFEGAFLMVPAMLLVTSSRVAVMSVVPTAIPVARPKASTLAMAASKLSHVAVDVRSAVLSSSKLPVAVNCWV